MKYISIFLFSLILTIAEAKVIDKIAGVINDQVFTLSEIQRIENTVHFRKEIAPFIYTKDKYTDNDILELLKNSYIIKDKLAELGYVISDDSVESRIRDTEKSLGLNRDELHLFLKSKGLTFGEYFELIREAMEFNIFNGRIIAPLVTITDQELKKYYYDTFSRGKIASYRYKIVDFSISQQKVPSRDQDIFLKALENYRISGNIPAIYSTIQTNDLGLVSGEDLPKNIKNVLSKTQEKSFSQPIKLNDQLHVFYIAKKDIVESSDFLRRKKQIYNQLFVERSHKIIRTWFAKESRNYYIVNNL